MFFLPAQISSSIIIIRDSYFTAIFIFFILYVFYLIVVKRNINIINFIILSLLGSFLSFYRSDAIIGILIGIFFTTLIYLRKSNETVSRVKIVLSIVTSFLLFYTLSLLPSILLKRDWVKGNTWGPRFELTYKLTLIENPLGYITRNNGIVTNAQKINIEKIFKKEDLINYWCPQNICLIYGDHWNKLSTNEERNAAFNSAIEVFVQNPKLLLLSRFETLNTVGNSNTQTKCSAEFMSERGYPRFINNDLLSDIGNTATKLIRETESYEGLFGGKRVWWNVYVSTIILFIIILFSKFTPASGVISSIIIARSVMVFLAAPAGFTVYYSTLFIGTPLIFLLFVCEFIKNFRK
jgi:hypothetical protein